MNLYIYYDFSPSRKKRIRKTQVVNAVKKNTWLGKWLSTTDLMSVLFLGCFRGRWGHKPSPGVTALVTEVWPSRLFMWSRMQRLGSVKGSSATASFIPQLTELGTWDSAAGAWWELSIADADHGRERVVGKAEVCGEILCAQQSLKACLRLLQAPVPLGARDWGHPSREAAEGIFWQSWPELTVALENEAGRGGEGHCFFCTNLSIRYLYMVSWGPRAALLPCQVEVHVGFTVCQERAAGHLQNLAGGAAGHPPPAGTQESRKLEWKRRGPGPAPCYRRLLGREDWAPGASKCQALSKQMCFTWSVDASVSVFLAGKRWVFNVPLRPLWFGCCP